MNKHYQNLNDFLKDVVTDIERSIDGFVSGEKYPFTEDLLHQDELFKELVEDSEEEIEIKTRNILEVLLRALQAKTEDVLSCHLDGGIFSVTSEEMVSETNSALSHNKLPGFTFGYWISR